MICSWDIVYIGNEYWCKYLFEYVFEYIFLSKFEYLTVFIEVIMYEVGLRRRVIEGNCFVYLTRTELPLEAPLLAALTILIANPDAIVIARIISVSAA